MPISVFAYQHGLYPRSERVVTATRGRDRGRVGREAVDAAFEQDLADFVRAQQKAGLDRFSDGLLRWQDVFRPLSEAAGTAPPEALVRWFDTNTFFREPELSMPVAQLSIPPAALPDRNVPQPRIATLPSPYLFSRAARSTDDRNALMIELAAKVIRPVIESAVAAGATLIHLEEPWLTYFGIAPGDWGPLGEALAQLDGLAPTLVLHTYFGDAAPHLQRLAELPVQAIGVDLLETDIASLDALGEKDLLLGCVDGRNSVLESADELVKVASRVADRMPARNLYLSSNCELGYLPTPIAERKVARLGEAAARLKELVQV